MKIKKITAVLCALAVITVSAGGLPFGGLRLFDTAITASAEAYMWDGTVPTSAPSGYIETDSTITIDSVEKFVWFYKMVGSGTNYSGKTVLLTVDIDLAEYNFGTVWNTAGHTFNGIFDGQNHIVSNFTFSSVSSNGQQYRWALFRNVNGATIKNLTMKNVSVGTGNSTGHSALIGMTQGSVAVENVHISSGRISGSRVVGGIVGQNKSSVLTIKNCSNSAEIIANSDSAGGIVGGSTTDSDQNTEISIENCTNTGAISSQENAGGIYGSIEPNNAKPAITFKNCTNGGVITATNAAEGYYYGKSNVNMTIISSEANAVIDLINAIGEVTLSDDCKGRIDTAREAYNKLAYQQQELVTNYATLTSAENLYANLATYTITIPESVNIDGGTAEFKAENVTLPDGAKINITVDGDNTEAGAATFNAKNEAGNSTVQYTINNGSADVADGGTALTFTEGGTQTLTFTKTSEPTYAGRHTETLTFGISVGNATKTVTWNKSDITGTRRMGTTFTKDGITVTAHTIDFNDKNFVGGGTFTTASGKFTKIEVTAPNDVSGTGWSGDASKKTWTGDASSSVSFSGSITGGDGDLTIVFTIEE